MFKVLDAEATANIPIRQESGENNPVSREQVLLRDKEKPKFKLLVFEASGFVSSVSACIDMNPI